jgi:hypothetical protein
MKGMKKTLVMNMMAVNHTPCSSVTSQWQQQRVEDNAEGKGGGGGEGRSAKACAQLCRCSASLKYWLIKAVDTPCSSLSEPVQA